MDADAKAEDFRILGKLLEIHLLDTEDQGKRTADAGEFMWMHQRTTHEGRTVGFKHRESRNYVFVFYPSERYSSKLAKVPRLVVPKEFKAFFRGTFDVHKMPTEEEIIAALLRQIPRRKA